MLYLFSIFPVAKYYRQVAVEKELLVWDVKQQAHVLERLVGGGSQLAEPFFQILLLCLWQLPAEAFRQHVEAEEGLGNRIVQVRILS